MDVEPPIGPPGESAFGWPPQVPPPPPAPQRRWGAGGWIVALAVSAGLLGLALGHLVYPRVRTAGRATGQLPTGRIFDPFGGSGSSTGPNATGAGGPANLSAVAAAVDPAVVDINVTLGYGNGQGAATGVVLTSTGEVLTNNHVVEGATRITATDVGNGRTYQATVLGYDRSRDIAVIQLHGASGLATARLGDSATVKVGQAVVAVGNAGGAGGTPSAAGGSVVALNQPVSATDEATGTSEQLTGLIQVNADVQPGDSGGPLVNGAEQVVGIDTAASAGYSFRSAGNDGFAIPIATAAAIAAQIESGTASTTVHVGPTAFLGVQLGSADGGSDGASAGALVAGTVTGTPAASAGLSAGDIITALGGQPVDSANTLTALMQGYHPGDRVQVSWTDPSGQQHTVVVTLATGPAA